MVKLFNPLLDHPESIIQLNTPRLQLKSFFESDVSEEYISWLNDPEINRYLESRFLLQTKETIQEWVRSTISSPTRMLLGIFSNQEHIGNVTFYMIEPIHKCLRVGITIGRRDLQGQGYGQEALNGVVRYVFETLKYNRIEAGIYSNNEASLKLFQKAGFYQEAVFKNQYDGCYERSEYYLVEVFKKGSSHNCLIVRHLETIKELTNPDDPQLRGVGAQYNKYIRENNIIIPEITLASEHSFFSRTTGGNWYRIIHAINPKILNSPDINSFTEESSEYHRSNISKYPEHKKTMDTWASISSKNHKRLEKIFKAKKHHLLNLDKYIKENDIEDTKNNVVEDLKKLNELYKSGAITKEEFKKAKKKLLN